MLPLCRSISGNVASISLVVTDSPYFILYLVRILSLILTTAASGALKVAFGSSISSPPLSSMSRSSSLQSSSEDE